MAPNDHGGTEQVNYIRFLFSFHDDTHSVGLKLVPCRYTAETIWLMQHYHARVKSMRGRTFIRFKSKTRQDGPWFTWPGSVARPRAFKHGDHAYRGLTTPRQPSGHIHIVSIKVGARSSFVFALASTGLDLVGADCCTLPLLEVARRQSFRDHENVMHITFHPGSAAKCTNTRYPRPQVRSAPYNYYVDLYKSLQYRRHQYAPLHDPNADRIIPMGNATVKAGFDGTIRSLQSLGCPNYVCPSVCGKIS